MNSSSSLCCRALFPSSSLEFSHRGQQYSLALSDMAAPSLVSAVVSSFLDLIPCKIRSMIPCHAIMHSIPLKSKTWMSTRCCSSLSAGGNVLGSKGPRVCALDSCTRVKSRTIIAWWRQTLFLPPQRIKIYSWRFLLLLISRLYCNSTTCTFAKHKKGVKQWHSNFKWLTDTSTKKEHRHQCWNYSLRHCQTVLLRVNVILYRKSVDLM